MFRSAMYGVCTLRVERENNANRQRERELERADFREDAQHVSCSEMNTAHCLTRQLRDIFSACEVMLMCTL